MNEQLAQENKSKLQEELTRLRKLLGHTNIADGSGEFPGDFKPKFDELGNEEGENASEVENFTNNLGVTQDLEIKLKKVEAALERIENGTYGQCSKGDEIEEDRLRALPEADTCMKHAA